MRIDSCRTCGEEMKEFQRCNECKEVISLICRACNRVDEPNTHLNCGALDRTVIL